MKKVTITNELNKQDYIQLKDLYNLFFQEILDLELFGYSEILSQKAIYKLQKTKNLSYINFWAVKDENDNIIGFLKAKFYLDGVGLICHLFVVPEYRAQVVQTEKEKGIIAKLLIDKVLAWFKSYNIDLVEIESSKSNPSLLKVEQQKYGFKIVEEFPDAYILQKN